MMLAIILASAILPIILVVGILGTLKKGQDRTDQLIRTGIPARGQIMQVGHTGMRVGVMGHYHIKLMLTVQVQPPQGGHPYPASFEQLISELQIPQVQPGAMVELRIDPANPARIALAWITPPNMQPMMQQPMQQQGAWGAPQQQAPGGWGAPQQQAPGAWGGAAGAPAPMMMVAQPQYKSAFPRIALIMFITTVPVTVILLYTFVDFSAWFGTKEQKDKGGVCGQVAECCKVMGSPNCDSYKMMPREGCEQSLEPMRQAAKAQGKSCD